MKNIEQSSFLVLFIINVFPTMRYFLLLLISLGTIQFAIPPTTVSAVAVIDDPEITQSNKANSPVVRSQQQNTVMTQNQVQSSTELESVQNRTQLQNQEQQQLQASDSVSAEEMGANLQRLALQHAVRLEYRFAYYEHRLAQIARKLQEQLQVMQQTHSEVDSLIEATKKHQARIQECAQSAQTAVDSFRELEPDPMNQAQTRLVVKGKDQAQQTRACFQAVVDSMNQTVTQAQKIQTSTQ